MSDKRKRAARAIMAETGWNYTRALCEADRRHAEAQAGCLRETGLAPAGALAAGIETSSPVARAAAADLAEAARSVLTPPFLPAPAEANQ